MKKIVLAALVLANFAGAASAQVSLVVPAPRVEVGPVPPPPGPPAAWVLEPGHWQWEGRWVWVRRHWVARRAGWTHFVPGHVGPAGRWIPGHWV